MTNTAKAFWYQGPNFGDALTPWLIKKISGRTAEHCHGSLNEPVLMVTGSIISDEVDGSVVWGCGFANCMERVPDIGRVCAVRGPKTREKLLAYGVDCPNVVGDPAILMPRFLPAAPEKKHHLAIIPHFVDYEAAKAAYGEVDGVQVVRLEDSVEDVVRQITECRMAVSSSLHGIIAAHAYGLPCLWVKFSNKVLGCGFKFHDYFASGGLPMVNPVDLSAMPDIATFKDTIPKQMPTINADALWAVCPFKP
jgi:hypothetical protein